MKEKINAAITYCQRFGADDVTRNDASNIFADSYDEYMAISEVLESQKEALRDVHALLTLQ